MKALLVGFLAVFAVTSTGCKRDGNLPDVSTPTLTQLDPLGPSREARPTLIGSADTGATVNVYLNDFRCESRIVGSGTADANGVFVIRIEEDLPLDQTVELTLSATLDERPSECTAPIEYRVDWTTPTLLGMESRVSQEEGTILMGSSDEPGLKVFIFANGDCTGNPVARGLTDAEGRFELKVDVPVDATELRVILEDHATNRSACPPFGLRP